MASVEITCVTIDCHDPETVATFWNEALRWGGVVAAADNSGAVCGPTRGGMYLEFIRVPEDKVVKNRVHLGCTAGTLEDLDVAWEEHFPPEIADRYRNLVLRDPEGNEFCLGAGRFPS